MDRFKQVPLESAPTFFCRRGSCWPRANQQAFVFFIHCRLLLFSMPTSHLASHLIHDGYMSPMVCSKLHVKVHRGDVEQLKRMKQRKKTVVLRDITILKIFTRQEFALRTFLRDMQPPQTKVFFGGDFWPCCRSHEV